MCHGTLEHEVLVSPELDVDGLKSRSKVSSRNNDSRRPWETPLVHTLQSSNRIFFNRLFRRRRHHQYHKFCHKQMTSNKTSLFNHLRNTYYYFIYDLDSKFDQLYDKYDKDEIFVQNIYNFVVFVFTLAYKNHHHKHSNNIINSSGIINTTTTNTNYDNYAICQSVNFNLGNITNSGNSSSSSSSDDIGGIN